MTKAPKVSKSAPATSRGATLTGKKKVGRPRGKIPRAPVTGVRIPEALLARIDAIVERRAAELAARGGTTSRSAMIIAALEAFCSAEEASTTSVAARGAQWTAPRPEVAAIVRPLLAYLGAELRARSSSVEELGLVVVAEGRDPAPVRELLGAEVTLRNVRGHQIAAVPLARLRELAQAVTFDVAAEFDVAIAPGQTWCLVLGLGSRAAVLVLHWPSSSALARRWREAN